MCLFSGAQSFVIAEFGEVGSVCVHVCFKQNMAHSSKKLFLPRLLLNLPSPSFPEGELLAHCAVKNQEMKREWEDEGLGGGVDQTQPKPSSAGYE